MADRDMNDKMCANSHDKIRALDASHVAGWKLG